MANKITSTIIPGAPHQPTDAWQASADGWTVQLRNRESGEHMTVAFWTGTGFRMFKGGRKRPVKPATADVLSCLAMDALGVEYARTFEEWADDLGYDTDSRRAERIWNTVIAQAIDLRRVLGEDLWEYMTEADDVEEWAADVA